MTQSSCKRDTKSKSHPGMKLAPVRVFSCKHPLTALVLLTFIHVGNENKRQYLKIHLLTFEKIWQKSCSHSNAVNESLKIHFEQRTFVTQSSFS